MILKNLKNIINNIKNFNKIYELNYLNKEVNYINYIEKKISNFNNINFINKTNEFKKRLIKNKENIDKMLPEAFALVKLACKKILKIKLFDSQIICAIILHYGKIAEMLTGEGKTLSAILPAYLNSLSGNSVHIVTVNDYLAKRDAENNRHVFELLGLKVGINTSDMSLKQKKESYKSDIVYGTNNEYGFDYLRDNMIFDISDKIQNDLSYAIIDEIDSILIDESRVPLIVSENDKNYSKIYIKINKLFQKIVKEFNIKNLNNNQYLNIDYKSKQIYFKELGYELFENLMIKYKFVEKNNELYSSKNIILVKYIINALKANIFFKKNIDYIIDNNNILIIDENTGRISKGKRWSDGIHQSIEAKENVKIKNENKMSSTVTFQSYFRLYNKISGMSGTAYTERKEFKEIYGLDVVKIPTNKKIIRKDYEDLIFLTEKDKFKNIVIDIKKRINNNQPILIGTSSIEKSEMLSNYLKKHKIKHNVLNAKYHKIEAEIISQAGKPKSVTIATNMAGRGTDIILGGNYKIIINKIIDKKNISLLKKKYKLYNKIVIESGGLHIIGTEKHESRRIDNQLKGRSGRQGDPGSSQFYLSFDDYLLKTFVSNNIVNFIKSTNLYNNNSINNIFLNKCINSAQLNIEKRNFEIRKQLIIYDNIINNQRNILYKIRYNLLNFYKTNKIFYNVYKFIIKNFINKIFYNKLNFENNLNKLKLDLKSNLNLKINFNLFIETHYNISLYNIKKNLNKFIINNIYLNINNFNKKKLNYIKKFVFIKYLDFFWKNHINDMEILKKSIFLRSYINKDPKQEYQIESFYKFKMMINDWKYESISTLNIIFYLSNNYKKNYNCLDLNNKLEFELFDNIEINNLVQFLIN